MLKLKFVEDIKARIAAADARPKSISANAFTTIFAFQFLVSFAMLALDAADVALTVVSVASSGGFSLINGIFIALFHLSTMCFSIAMWAKLNNVANFWKDMSVFSSLVVWVGFSLVIFISNFANGSSCLSQIIASVTGEDYQCSGYHLSISVAYALTALWEGFMYFVCALIWARKCYRIRGYGDLELLRTEEEEAEAAPEPSATTCA